MRMRSPFYEGESSVCPYPLAKWATADPLGYPDGWNQLAYCGNEVVENVDWLGACTTCASCGSKCSCRMPHYYYPEWFHEDGEDKKNLYCLGRDGFPVLNPKHPVAQAIEDYVPNAHYFAVVHDSWIDSLNFDGAVDIVTNIPSMPFAYLFAFAKNMYNSFLDFLDYGQDKLGLKLVDVDQQRMDPVVLYQCSCLE